MSGRTRAKKRARMFNYIVHRERAAAWRLAATWVNDLMRGGRAREFIVGEMMKRARREANGEC